MAVISKAVPFGAARRKGQYGIESVRSLNRRLLVDAEDRGVLRWVEVEADDIRGFGLEIRIAGGPAAFQSMRLQAGLLPHAMHYILTDTQRNGQFPATPVGRAIARFAARRAQDSRAQSGVSTVGFWPGWYVSRPSMPFARNRSFHRMIVGAVVWSCGLIMLKDAPSSQQQNQFGAEHITRRQRARLGDGRQLRSLPRGRSEGSRNARTSIDAHVLVSVTLRQFASLPGGG